jgi:predicted phage terminase large subunit-like protein
MKARDPQYFGKVLIENQFRVWFKYMFTIIEDNQFIEEALHKDLFQAYQDIYDMKSYRDIINISPRSSKTSMASYFIAFVLAIDSRANFIYTSYSQTLLGSIAKKVCTIMEHPVYKAMYGNQQPIETITETNPIDDFWANYLKTEEHSKTNMYSATKITTIQGGVVLFSAIGASLTGFGVARRGSMDKFSGALIIDDPNKVSDMRSPIMREKVFKYFDETLLSRLNHSKASIIIIQQRLHVEDLSGYILSKYNNYKHTKKPLIENDVCQLPLQYPHERLLEIKKDDYTFQSQYQQSPILDGGNIIKENWFNYYETLENDKYNKMFLTGDTASKTKEHNDYSVFCVWGVTIENKIYLLDMVRGKWEVPELRVNAINLYLKWKGKHLKGSDGKINKTIDAFYIEDKSSGTALIQDLGRSTIPVSAVQVNKDKAQRLRDVLGYIESGRVFLPKYNSSHILEPFISECVQFSGDGSHKHDDIVDNLTIALTKAFVENIFIDYSKINQIFDQY